MRLGEALQEDDDPPHDDDRPQRQDREEEHQADRVVEERLRADVGSLEAEVGEERQPQQRSPDRQHVGPGGGGAHLHERSLASNPAAGHPDDERAEVEPDKTSEDAEDALRHQHLHRGEVRHRRRVRDVGADELADPSEDRQAVHPGARVGVEDLPHGGARPDPDPQPRVERLARGDGGRRHGRWRRREDDGLGTRIRDGRRGPRGRSVGRRGNVVHRDNVSGRAAERKRCGRASRPRRRCPRPRAGGDWFAREAGPRP